MTRQLPPFLNKPSCVKNSLYLPVTYMHPHSTNNYFPSMACHTMTQTNTVSLLFHIFAHCEQPNQDCETMEQLDVEEMGSQVEEL